MSETEKKMSYVDVLVRVKVGHLPEQSPEEVIAACNYEFVIEPDEGKDTPIILDTEITEARFAGECDAWGVLWRENGTISGLDAWIVTDEDENSSEYPDDGTYFV